MHTDMFIFKIHTYLFRKITFYAYNYSSLMQSFFYFFLLIHYEITFIVVLDIAFLFYVLSQFS